ncbi:antibiotic biosynthesis monooxygenase [Neorhizobium sp. NCHU2750]|uniref:putative quinol monooxygenase n=1 Tax=Neorhizobium sp. NCHU2750 TaxID=1825976 RepID=UPI000E73672C|nr:antibiotic biosynthesis monooxygenase [Neorhizobium sp. NCHU2750]
MLIVTGTLSLPSADLADFIGEVKILASIVRQRDGNLSYDTAVLDAATGRLLVAERWQDCAALDAHLHADDTAAFIARWHERMRGDVRIYDVDDERPLEADRE